MSEERKFVFDGPMRESDNAAEMIERVSYGLMGIRAVLRGVQNGHPLEKDEAEGLDYLLSGLIETLHTTQDMAASLIHDARRHKREP